jgi:hypothetical protein
MVSYRTRVVPASHIPEADSRRDNLKLLATFPLGLTSNTRCAASIRKVSSHVADSTVISEQEHQDNYPIENIGYYPLIL